MAINNQYRYGRGIIDEGEDNMLHRNGKKFAGSHTTIIDETAEMIDFADKLPEVTKIVLGPIRNMKGLKISVKFTEIGAGWKIIFCGNTARQEIFFYTSEREKVQNAIFEKFPEFKPAPVEKKTK